MKASKRTLVFVFAGAVLLGLSGWVAWAQIGASGTVVGCVGNSGIIRGVDETTGTCRSGDTPLSWYTKAGADAAFAPADPPCFNITTRYADCGNGTVTDTVTGLIWLKQWNCLPNNDWAAANQAAARLKDGDCGLTDKSSAGDWRLPTKDEWSATIARAVALGCSTGRDGVTALSLTNDAGTACYDTGVDSSFAGVASDYYWSSATLEDNPTEGAWGAYLGNGNVYRLFKSAPVRVWPVRGGPR